MKTIEVKCPKCGAPGPHQQVPMIGDHPNMLLWLLGGFILDIAFRSSKPIRFKCAQCEARFEYRTTGARIAQFTTTLIFALIVLGFIAWYRENF